MSDKIDWTIVIDNRKMLSLKKEIADLDERYEKQIIECILAIQIKPLYKFGVIEHTATTAATHMNEFRHRLARIAEMLDEMTFGSDIGETNGENNA